MTYESGVSVSGAYARKSGNVVQYNFNAIVTTSSKSAFNALLTLPDTPSLPHVTIFFPAVDTNSGTIYELYISGSTLSTRLALPSGVNLVGSVVYISAS